MSSETISTPSISLLAISGSLRAASSNTALLRALEQLGAPSAMVTLYTELEQIPPFNPDIEDEKAPEAVVRLRAHVRDAAGIFFSTPEYAHGVPGVLKNALDWLVGGCEILGKPVAIVRPSARADLALASLQETLTVMNARFVPAASVSLTFTTNRLDVDTFLADAGSVRTLRAAMDAMLAAIALLK